MFHSRAADTGGAARIPPTRPLSLERASVSMGGRVKRVRLARLRLHPLLLLAEASSALRARSGWLESMRLTRHPRGHRVPRVSTT